MRAQRALPLVMVIVPCLLLVSLAHAQQTTPKRIRIAGNVQPPLLVQRIEPVYPPLAAQAGITGTLELDVVIARDGSVAQVEVLNGHPLLVQAAIDGIRQWRYQPTLLNGEPVEVVITTTLVFTLDEPEGNRPDGKVRPSPETRLRLRLVILTHRSEYHRAFTELQAFIEKNPGNVWAREEIASVLSQLNRNLEAISAIREALRIQPENLQFHSRLFSLLVEADFAYDAIYQFREMKRYGNPDAADMADVGLLLYRLQNPESAASEFKFLAQDSSDPAAAHAQLAKKLLEAVRLDAAGHHVDEAIRLAESPGRYQARQQEIQIARQLVENGMPVLRQRLRQQSGTPAVQAALAFGLLAQGKWESEGRAQYRVALEIGFDEIESHHALAFILANRLGARAALAELQALAAGYPAAINLHLPIAEFMARLGEPDRAILELRAALAASPKNTSLRERLVAFLLNAGDTAGAAAETEVARHLPEPTPSPSTLLQLAEELSASLRAAEQLANPMATYEMVAVGALRVINTACVQYAATYEQGFPVSLASLTTAPGAEGQPPSAQYADLIDTRLASGTKDGYTFLYVVTATDPEGRPSAYEAYADPVRPGVTGTRFFFTDQSGVIRFNLAGRARVTDPPVQ